VTLPVGITTPPMLAKRSEKLPEGPGWLYEPKWDGFRALAGLDQGEVSLVSRDGRDLVRYLPELVDLLARRLTEGSVVDGEVVIVTEGSLDFGALLQRIHPADSRVRMLAGKTPATFVAFDVLASSGRVVMGEPFTERIARLEGSIGMDEDPAALAMLEGGTGGEPLAVAPTPRSDDPAKARRWLTEFDRCGLDGVVAKQADMLYSPGKREMVKVKQVRTCDCVVAGYRLNKPKDGIGSLLLGLYDDAGNLHYVGHTSSFKAKERRELLARLQEMHGDSFAGGRTPGGPSRWSHGRDTDWFPVRPELVCEVSFDRMLGERFRHGATFVRWRPERKARECGFDQVALDRG
jgi:ATP-dependent DNA ligase